MFIEQDSQEYCGIYVNLEYVVLFILERILNINEINQHLNEIVKWIKNEDVKNNYFIKIK